MTTIRDIPDPIHWHEGMLLAPQHFQQESLRGQASLSARLGLATTYPYGLVHMVLDRVALVSGMVRVLELEAIMPDGLTVWHDQSSPHPLELDVSEHADPLAQVPLTVYVTVPAAQGAQRWQSVEGRPVPDETSGEELAIPRLRPRLGLAVTTMPTERPPQRLVSLPIGRVSFSNDAFVMSDYAPPAMVVAANSVIGRLCADVARRLREKAMLLAERASTGGSGNTNGVDPNDEIRALVTGLPTLEAQLAAEVAHPFQVYLSMCGLVGHIAGLSSGKVPPKLSRYDHDDALPAFTEIRDYVVRMVERVREVAEPIRFSFENGMFGLEMTEDWLRGQLVIGVRPPPAMATSEVVAWIENAVIASRSKLEHLATLRVKGVDRETLEADGQSGIVAPRGTVLFRLDADADLVVPGERLEIWNPDNLGSRMRPAEIVLYVLS